MTMAMSVKPQQKEREERQLRLLLNGLVQYASIKLSEQPDFWVLVPSGAHLAVEVTEYHPESDAALGTPRKEVESRWADELYPMLDQLRRANPSLADVHVHLSFKDKRLPKRKDHQRLAREIVALVEDLANFAAAAGGEAKVAFAPRAVVAHQVATSGQSNLGEWVLRASEDWPLTSKHLDFLNVRRWTGLAWPPWGLPEVEAAWLGPDVDEFKRILVRKTERVAQYRLDSAPLWLLIVCEDHGDLQSHIFPRSDLDVTQLAQVLDQTGFDFEAGPFAEVWLLSTFSGQRLRLYPPHT